MAPSFGDRPIGRRTRRPALAPLARLARPRVTAHRGASVSWAEHTLTAYKRALEQGADGLECDVRLTADGHLVCVHDRRVERTSNGRGPVSTLGLNDLESLDWEAWKRPWRDLDDADADVDDDAGLSFVTLERLLDLVRDWDRPVEVAIETKHPTRYAGLVERRLIELLDRYGWARPRRGGRLPVRVMSFSWMGLRRCLEMAPRLETVYLMERVPLRFRDGTLPLGASIAGPSIEIIRAHPEYVERVHAAGHEVHVWTVNAVTDLDLCADLGVDTVITDDPGAALRRLGRGIGQTTDN